MKDSNLAIIIPSYNEKANLIKLLPILVKKYPRSRIIVVDDNSPDQTASYVLNFSSRYKQVFCIKRAGKLGRGSACMQGFQNALNFPDTDYVLEMDADFSHDPDEIKLLLNKASPKRIVIGSRYVKGSRIINWPSTRRILSLIANFYTRIILNIPINDYTNGFRLYPRSAIKKLIDSGICEKGYAALSESAFILHKNGFSFLEVPTVFVSRRVGKSNTNLFEYLNSLIAIIKIRLSY